MILGFRKERLTFASGEQGIWVSFTMPYKPVFYWEF